MKATKQYIMPLISVMIIVLAVLAVKNNCKVVSRTPQVDKTTNISPLFLPLYY